MLVYLPMLDSGLSQDGGRPDGIALQTHGQINCARCFLLAPLPLLFLPRLSLPPFHRARPSRWDG